MMKYTKISGTFLKFDSGQRIETGVSYASQDIRPPEIIAHTFANGKFLETVFELEGPGLLDFVARTNDSKTPDMIGHFFSSDYEDCVLSALIPEQKISVTGVVTKLDPTHALCTKTVSEISSGKIIGIMQERVELITEAEFNAATRIP